MSRRKDAKALARWDNEARQWATATGRDLALDLYYNRETAARPYGVGVVLDSGEKVWAEVPVRFNLDWPPLIKPGELAQPSVRTWLVTSARVVGRLADDRLHGYRWERAVGARVDLTPGREVVSLDIENEPTLIWTGPGRGPFGRGCGVPPLWRAGDDRSPRPGPTTNTHRCVRGQSRIAVGGMS